MNLNMLDTELAKGIMHLLYKILKFLRSDFFGSFLYLTIVAHRFAESSLLEKCIGNIILAVHSGQKY